MCALKIDHFNDRQATSAKAKKALQEKFLSRPGPDDPAVQARLAEQKAIAEAREVRQAERRAVKAADAVRQAEEEAVRRIEQEALDAEVIARKAREAEAVLELAAKQKAARDARYAARNARRK